MKTVEIINNKFVENEHMLKMDFLSKLLEKDIESWKYVLFAYKEHLFHRTTRDSTVGTLKIKI